MKLIKTLRWSCGAALVAAAGLLTLSGCADGSGNNTNNSSNNSSSSSGTNCKPGTAGCTVVINCPTGTTFKPFVNASPTDTTFTASSNVNGVCTNGIGICSVTDVNNVTDPTTNLPATISVSLGLLGADAAITVKDNTGSFPAGDVAGFIISFPAAQLITLSLFEPITVTTINNGVDGASGVNTRDVALDLLTLLSDPQAFVGLTVTATTQFNALRIDVGGLANVLSNVDVFTAGVCVAD